MKARPAKGLAWECSGKSVQAARPCWCGRAAFVGSLLVETVRGKFSSEKLETKRLGSGVSLAWFVTFVSVENIIHK